MWVAVSTQPHREGMAIDNLLRQGYDVYCPMIEKKISHARKVCTVKRPLFPGYLFVKLNEQLQGWRAIHSTFGVRHLVSFGGQPARLPEQFIAELKTREVQGCIPAEPLENVLPAGTVVLIKKGIFKDLIATVLSCRPQDRVVVMLDLLKRTVKTEVPAECIERA